MIKEIKEKVEDAFWIGYMAACLPLIMVLEVWECDNRYMD